VAKPAFRLRLVQAAFAISIIALVARAAQIQLVRGGRYADMARAQRTQRVILPARRGGIFDRNGVPLASTQESFHVGVAPKELRNPQQDARVIASALGLSPREVDRALKKRYAYFHGPFGSTRVESLRPIHGVHLTAEFVRFYPDPRFARSLLGRPGSDGRPADGIERVFDSLLAGQPGSAVVLRDGTGRQLESPSRLDAFPIPGSDVTLTIDADLQDIVDRALAEAIEGFSAAGGDIVVMDPRSGEILAVTSRAADGGAPASAFNSPFEPGSTAKLFAAAGLLSRDRVRRSDSVWGENGKYQIRLRPTPITDDHPEGWMSLDRVIAVSSNIGIVKFAARLQPDEQFDMLRRFGLGSPTGVEFPTESPGLLELPHHWSGTTAASLAMGYEVAVTPVQLAQAYSAIANDGVMLQPTLVKAIRRPDGDVFYRHTPEPVRRVVSPEIAIRLRQMLRGVVSLEGATGTTAALATYEVAGKTGTSKRAGPRGYIPGAYTASFASLFPADQPQLVMVVKLDDPKGAYARLTAAPVTRSVLEQLLATQTRSLDRARLKGNAPPSTADATIEAGTVPHVFLWPPNAPAAVALTRSIPDVRGLTIRAAARRLHQEGLQTRVTGWGTVTETTPPRGTVVKAGTSVMLTAQ
jgi:cell division protein FtsI (penicillin-binding protein 3)